MGIVMNLYKNPIALTCQFYHCTIPFRLDTYRGCQFFCAYCFAIDRNLNINMNDIQPADFSIINFYFKNAFEKENLAKNVIIECLRRKMPIHFGGMSDPFQPIEKKLKVSLKTLSLLKKYDYPTVISTKSDLLLEKKYLNVLNGMKVAVQITLTTSRDEIAKKLEPNTPSVDKRLELFSRLSDMDIWTACRLQPLIPKVNTQDFELIDKLSDAGCRHVLIEHYKLPTYANRVRRKLMSKICSFDIERYYRERCSKPSGMFFEIPLREKIENLTNLVRYIHHKRMTYGAADNDLHDLGDDMCCCGVRYLEGFQDVYKHNNTKAVFEGKSSCKIYYSFIEREWSPKGSIRCVVNRKSRLKSINGKQASSVSDFVRVKWNTPFSNNSPTDMVNVIPSGEYDEKGNLIYRYVNKFKL